MNISVRQDFSQFTDFVRKFSLEEVTDAPDKMAVMRTAHVQFLALLTVTGEVRAAEGSGYVQFVSSYGKTGSDYFGEVISDCSEFIMCATVGLYRSAGGTLRSSIESYLKAFSAQEVPLILQRTSVPQVFDDAATVAFFSTRVGKKVVGELHATYSELNYFVHTVSEDNMFGALAVGSFPRWSENSVRLINLFVRIVRLFIYGFVASRRDLYDSFDHRNKVIVNRAMTRVQRRSAMGVDE
jgi:hypothetical protein